MVNRIEKGITRVNVHEVNRGEVGELLFSGVFMGFGTINLGINGTKQGVMVMSDVDDKFMSITLHAIDACLFIKENICREDNCNREAEEDNTKCYHHN
jgi:hypothetical protein